MDLISSGVQSNAFSCLSWILNGWCDFFRLPFCRLCRWRRPKCRAEESEIYPVIIQTRFAQLTKETISLLEMHIELAHNLPLHRSQIHAPSLIVNSDARWICARSSRACSEMIGEDDGTVGFNKWMHIWERRKEEWQKTMIWSITLWTEGWTLPTHTKIQLFNRPKP